IDVAVGFYEVFQNRFYNSCLYATLGGPDAGVKHVHRKVFLPTYGVFDEERFVERGHEVRAFDTRFGRAAILICEDAWHSLTATIAALDGAQLLVLPSASPARGTGKTEGEGESLPASVVRWERIVRNIAEEHGVFVVYASLVGFEGGKGFPGGSLVVLPSGEIALRGPIFEEAVLTADLDFDLITQARADAPLLADLEVNLPHLVKNLGKRETGNVKRKRAPVKFDPAANGASGKSAIRNPQSAIHVVGRSVDEGDPLAIDPELARADDRAVRPLREIPRAPPRHRQQVGAPARLLHLARRRLAARESAGRSLQDSSMGAGAPRRRARGDRDEARHRRPDPRPDRRGRLRDLLSQGRPHPV